MLDDVLPACASTPRHEQSACRTKWAEREGRGWLAVTRSRLAELPDVYGARSAWSAAAIITLVLLEVSEAGPAAVLLPEWVQIVAALGPLVTLSAAIIAGSIALAALRQRRAADAKAEWWRRTQWAFDQIPTDDPAHEDVGTAALELLQNSQLATKEDLDLLVAGWDAVLEDVPEDEPAYEMSEDGRDD